MKRLIIPISGMHCASCAVTIEKSLKKSRGISNSSVNFATERATVDYDENETSETLIKEIIKKTGYNVVEKHSQNKTTLKVIGMSSPHCASIVESALNKLEGIKNADLNFATEKAVIEFDPMKISVGKIKKTIQDAGYEPVEESIDREKLAREHEINTLKRDFLISLVLTIPIAVLAFSEFFNITLIKPELSNLIQFILATPIQLVVGYRFYKSAFFALKNLSANMDTLIAVGTTAAYLYSVLIIFNVLTGGIYFDTAAIIITFILLGKYMEAIVKGKTSEAIKKLIGLQPNTATTIRKGKEIQIPIEQVQVNDIILVKPGERIPTDGVVIDGHSTVDESMITGESIPIEKSRGSEVIGATINQHGLLKIRASKIGRDTMLSQIIKFVEEAQSSKAPVQKLVDKISNYFVPVVLIVALLSFVVWFISGNTVLAISSFVAVLIIACPCALGLATPTAIIMGTGKGAQNGILIKNAETLEKTHKLTTVIFDKTGTLTEGKPQVTDIISIDKNKEKEVLKFAAIAEKGSEHPLSSAILDKAKSYNIKIPDAHKFIAIPGKGVRAKYLSKEIIVGNRKLLEQEKIEFDDQVLESLESQGKTSVIIAINKKVVGIISAKDVLKENSKETIQVLKSMNKEVYMITGDNQRTANAIASELNIDNILASVLPNEKSEKVKELQTQGKVVAFIGDGINDAPALAQADIGIAIGSGTDIAIETGNIILVKSDLRDVINSINLSEYTLKKIKQNLFWAFAYNVVGIPIAAGILYPAFQLTLNPAIAAIAMAFSSVSVVSNSLLMKNYKFRR
ncbi:heavy metal translocating P-type ATPase [Candidatus Woesearchaeota archaeon]|nr:heavy metal translocating P-type ATPase [Candidatus Woesearchaeota archaeon]